MTLEKRPCQDKDCSVFPNCKGCPAVTLVMTPTEASLRSIDQANKGVASSRAVDRESGKLQNQK